MLLQNRLTGLRQDERRKAIGHWFGIEHDHAVGWPHREFGRERGDGQARHLANDGGGAAAVAERHVGTIRQKDSLNRALAGDQRGSLVPTAVKPLRFGLERVMRTQYRIDDFQQTYFVIRSYEELMRATVDTDFAPLYGRLADEVTYSPETVLPGDGVIHHGTQAYAKAKAKAGG